MKVPVALATATILAAFSGMQRCMLSHFPWMLRCVRSTSEYRNTSNFRMLHSKAAFVSNLTTRLRIAGFSSGSTSGFLSGTSGVTVSGVSSDGVKTQAPVRNADRSAVKSLILIEVFIAHCSSFRANIRKRNGKRQFLLYLLSYGKEFKLNGRKYRQT